MREHRQQLVASLAQADHQTRLGWRPWGQLLRPSQQLERLDIDGFGSHPRVEAWHALEVVVQDVWTSLHHRRQGVPVALEIGNKDFDPEGGVTLFELADRGGEDGRA